MQNGRDGKRIFMQRNPPLESAPSSGTRPHLQSVTVRFLLHEASQSPCSALACGAPHLASHRRDRWPCCLCHGDSADAGAPYRDSKKDLQQAQAQHLEARKSPPPTTTELFEKSLPSSQVAEAVARDITAFAATSNVQLNSVQIENQTGTQGDYATVVYQVNAKGEYRQTKQWIAELLGRYETLAIKSMSVQSIANDTARQDVRMTLVLYVRD